MTKILTQAEIDALLTNVSSSVAEEQAEEKKVSLYDFKQPNLVSKDQLRILENIHEDLVRNFGVYLSTQLRMIVDMKLVGVEQIMYSEFMMSISNPGAIYIGTISDPESQFILELDPRLAIFIVERLFGGKGSFVSSGRPISMIEQRVMQRVVEKMAKDIADYWKPLKKFKTSFERYESNPEFVQIVPASEPVVVVFMEVQIYNITSLVNICYPYMWISNLMSIPDVQRKILFGTRKTSKEDMAIIKKNLKNTIIDIQAILGSTTIELGDFLNLKEGDVILTNSMIDEDISIMTGSKSLYSAAIGKQNKNYACMINNIHEGDKENEF